MILAFAVCVLAAGWLFLPPGRFPDVSTFYICIAGAFLALFIGRQRITPIIQRGWYSLPAAVILFLYYMIWADPSGVGALILAMGIVIGSLLGRDRLSQRVADAAVSLGSILLFQQIGSYLYYYVVGPRAHSAEPFATIINAIFNVLGINSGVTTAGIHLLSADILYQVVPSLNNMGLFFFLQVFLGILALIAVGRMRFRAWWRAALILLVYMLFRYIAIMAYDISQSNQGNYWWPSITAWTSIWVFLFLRGSAFAPRPRTANPPQPRPLPAGPWRKALIIAGCTIIAVVAWTMREKYEDPGRMKQGRLLIDEYHSEWEKSDKVMDSLWYGQESTYNFYSGAEFYGKFYEMKRGYSPFTPEYLAQFDVIVLKTPTKSYSLQEVAAVRQWVKNGGGLVLIGDHTNVFGSATFLNQIAMFFGLRFSSDSAYEIVTGDLSVYQELRTLPHPVTQNLPLFFWGGQCTLRGDCGVRGVMTDVNIKTLPADYSERNFFPERTAHTGYRFGPFFTVACATCGKGRIICFTDSTLISNFFIFIPGKAELMLAMADWANRAERFPGWRMFLLLVGGCALAVAMITAAAFGARGFVWLLAAGFGTFLVSATLIQKANFKNYPLPEPRREYKQLIFEGEYSRFFIPELRLANNQDKDFHTFYVWTQRVGVYPRKYYTFDKCLAEADKMGAFMMIDIARVPTPEQNERLKTYVQNGGTLVIIDDPENQPTPTNTLLGQFGLNLDFNERIVHSGPRTAADPIWDGAAPVVGGETLLAAPDGTPVVAQAKFGQGRVIAYGNSWAFERKTLGFTSMVPNDQQMAMSRFVYQFMDWIFPSANAGRVEQPETGM